MKDRQEFNGMLKEANLSKKDFARILKTSYNTVNAWGSNGREIPYWVKTWLKLYICCNNGIKLRDLFKNHICKDVDGKNFAKMDLPIIKDS